MSSLRISDSSITRFNKFYKIVFDKQILWASAPIYGNYKNPYRRKMQCGLKKLEKEYAIHYGPSQIYFELEVMKKVLWLHTSKWMITQIYQKWQPQNWHPFVIYF